MNKHFDLRQYKLKPEIIEAVLVNKHNFAQVAEWCDGDVAEKNTETGTVLCVRVITSSGTVCARIGDIVAKDSTGRYYVYDQTKFFEMHDEIGEATDEKPTIVEYNAYSFYTENTPAPKFSSRLKDRILKNVLQ